MQIGALVTAIPMVCHVDLLRVLNAHKNQYQAEVSTPESRGFMVSMHGVMFAMGK